METQPSPRVEALQQLFADLDVAGEHFREAARQIALGLAATVRAFEQAAAPDNPLRATVAWIAPVLPVLRTVLEQWAEQRRATDAIDVESLVAVRNLVSARLTNLQPTAAEERRAWILLLALLDQEIEAADAGEHAGRSTTEHSDNSADTLTWIEVEG
ncbi:MAG: hypothetical protein D6761_06175 [Candidatus Dadabacteria bacterium]|nr:MAG: hypothetical protein D6761_06175 [Candidatus Dadabacteria bacterium]